MSSNLNPRVVNLNRFDGKGGAVAFFDVVLADTIVLKGLTLRQTKEGSWRWSSPAKQRIKKGVAVKNDKGEDIWDDHFKLFYDTESSKPSTAARAFETEVLEQAIAKYESVSQREAGRGPRPATTTAPGAKVAKAAADYNEDDDLPY